MSRKNSKTVGITGASGLLGWHLRCRLHTAPHAYRIITANRQTFRSAESLAKFVIKCDVIVHLAGMNRGPSEDIESVNLELANLLVSALSEQDRIPHLIFSSSIHAEIDTPYGRSKRKASEQFSTWSKQTGGLFTNLVLPHVFGECGKPFHNSVISTFCHQAANLLTPVIEADGKLELLHAQDVADLIADVVDRQIYGSVRPPGRVVKVSQILDEIQDIAACYRRGIIPDLRQPFDLQLFNTYRSYLYPQQYPVTLQLRSDDRGTLFEAVKSNHGGQAFMSTTKPGVTRGNHFHVRKLERFLVVSGDAMIRIRRLFSSHVTEFRVNGNAPTFVDMPTMHTHNISNIGAGELLTLFWSHEIFDSERPDTYSEPVLGGIATE